MPWDQKKMLASLKFKLNWMVIPMQTRSTTAWKVGNSNRSSLILGTLAIRNLTIKKSLPINTQKLYWLGGQPELSCGPYGELWLVWRRESDFPWRERTLKSGGFCLKLRTWCVVDCEGFFDFDISGDRRAERWVAHYNNQDQEWRLGEETGGAETTIPKYQFCSDTMLE